MNRWNKLVSKLKRECPTKRRRVVVKRVSMEDYGSTKLSDSTKVITVTIRKSDSLSVQEDTLAHEWGHVLEYDAWDIHGKAWGKNYVSSYAVLESFRE